MKAVDHSEQLEEVMAYMDGALDAEAAAHVRLHLATCEECRRAEHDLRQISERLQAWAVGSVPARLVAPAESVTPMRRRLPAWAFSGPVVAAAAAGLVLTVAMGVSFVQRLMHEPGSRQAVTAPPDSANEMALGLSAVRENELSYQRRLQESTPAAKPPGEAPGQLIVRSARLSIVATDFDSTRAEIERIVNRSGGFVGQLLAHGARGTARSLSATLRVPTRKTDETLAALRALGQVTSDAQNGEDVTQQSADLDLRLANARVSEKRLREILEHRTGKLSDVLDVEREIARVRGEIEGMESERKSLDRRVTYATIVVSITEDRKSEVNLGPVPISRRLRNALVEGSASAIGSVVDAALVAARIGPSVILWGLLLAVPVWLGARRFRAG